jgi:signal transduction histidine kinase
LLLIQGLAVEAIDLINTVASQLNLLLSLINDVLDIKLIEDGKFVPNPVLFNPVDVLVFIKGIFEAQARIIQTKLSFETVSAAVLDQAV